jgi:hypothetical protein
MRRDSTGCNREKATDRGYDEPSADHYCAAFSRRAAS